MSFQAIREIRRYNKFTGSFWELRKKLGSLDLIFGTSSIMPKSHSMADSEYRKLLAENEVYAVIENRWKIMSRMKGNLDDLTEVTEQILTALETLDE